MTSSCLPAADTSHHLGYQRGCTHRKSTWASWLGEALHQRRRSPDRGQNHPDAVVGTTSNTAVAKAAGCFH
jgi:hypothetical protein